MEKPTAIEVYDHNFPILLHLLIQEMATASYDLWKKERKDYKQLSDLQLPRLRAAKDKLYELEIVEEDVLTQRVKVHYIGYGSEDDEWRDKDEIVDLKPMLPGKK